MKFRDLKTGEVFDNIYKMLNKFCTSVPDCEFCPLLLKNGFGFCQKWVREHPAEAARLMGYEVIEERSCHSCEHYKGSNICGFNGMSVEIMPDAGCISWKEKEVNMEKKDKPRLAEVLGVEVGERFQIAGEQPCYFVDKKGVLKAVYTDGSSDFISASGIYTAINHPESIIRAPRLTEAEIAICKALGAKWVSRGAFGTKSVILWDAKPECFDDGTFGSTDTAHKLARMYTGFESIHTSDCICVEEAGGDEE